MIYKDINFASAKPKRVETEHWFAYMVTAPDAETTDSFKPYTPKMLCRFVNPNDRGEMLVYSDLLKAGLMEDNPGCSVRLLGIYREVAGKKVLVV